LRDPDLIIERAKLIPALAPMGSTMVRNLISTRGFLAWAECARITIRSGERRAKEELHADHVIGADGATSRVARAAGWPPVETFLWYKRS